MEYSPFKDYFNLCSFLFKNQESSTKEDVYRRHDEQNTERTDGIHNFSQTKDLFDTSFVEELLDDPHSLDSIGLLDDLHTPDCISESDVFEYPSIVDLQTNTMDDKQRQYFRSESLSSGQYSSSSDESFTEEMASDIGSADFSMSAFFSQYSLPESSIKTPVQYFLPRKSMEDKYCILCKRNGETREYYTTHVLKDNRGKVICPVLRKYVCPNCNATGDNTHTLRHCPLSENKSSSTTETCYTLMSSCGRRRKRAM